MAMENPTLLASKKTFLALRHQLVPRLCLGTQCLAAPPAEVHCPHSMKRGRASNAVRSQAEPGTSACAVAISEKGQKEECLLDIVSSSLGYELEEFSAMISCYEDE